MWAAKRVAGRERELKRGSEHSCSLIQSSNVHMGGGGPGAQKSIWILQVNVRNPRIWAIIWCSPRCVFAGNWVRGEDGQPFQPSIPSTAKGASFSQFMVSCASLFFQFKVFLIFLYTSLSRICHPIFVY